MINTNKQRLRYIFGDWLSSSVAWFLYNCIRYYLDGGVLIRGGYMSLQNYLQSPRVILVQIAVPIIMMFVYAISGYYNEVFRKSNVQNLISTFYSCVVNSILIFFIVLINDVIQDHRTINYEMVLVLMAILFLFVFPVRFGITSYIKRQIREKKLRFNVLIIGANKKAVEFKDYLINYGTRFGYNLIGFVDIGESKSYDNSDFPVYSMEELSTLCKEKDIAELIVIPAVGKINHILGIINKLFYLNIPIKISPDVYNILLGKARVNDMYGLSLVDIAGDSMSPCQTNIKRLADIVISFIAMVLLIPIYLIIAIVVKLDSKGNVIYCQERIGYHNKPFTIYKFRTMMVNAEENDVPMLSSEGDSRITNVGKFLRKYRLDELPQFWNVFKGEMSLVGPRPERQYYIDKIVKRAPFYMLVHRVRPGLTSMGMVKYGYACSVDEMIKRLKYDLMYLENMSISNDIKILIYTIKIVITGRGL